MTASTCTYPAVGLAGHPQQRAWRPPVDVVEAEDEFVLRLDVPGVADDSVNVVLDRGRLTVSGSREAATDGRSHLSERRSGSFERVFRLGSAVDEENVDAKLDRGVLTIRVPKADTKRTIQVQ